MACQAMLGETRARMLRGVTHSPPLPSAALAAQGLSRQLASCRLRVAQPPCSWEGEICIYLDLSEYVHLTGFRMILSVK